MKDEKAGGKSEGVIYTENFPGWFRVTDIRASKHSGGLVVGDGRNRLIFAFRGSDKPFFDLRVKELLGLAER